jgi:TonB-linked SusC/RagA family outer membrane protein
MKRNLIIFIFQLLLLSGFTNPLAAQNTTFTLEFRNVTVKAALDEIEKHADYSFVYSEKIVDVNRVINVTLNNDNIEQALTKIFSGTNVTFTLKGRQVVLSSPDALAEPSVGGQLISVSGKVTDSIGVPVQAVSVRIKGTNKGITTDENGIYTLTEVPSDATLQFSFVGMIAREIYVGGKSIINISMQEEKKDIDEVVVIGYGVVKKRDLTGAVSSVKAADVDLTAAPSIAHALKGKAAGLTVIQNSAQPGGGLSISVRGNGSPLSQNQPMYIVDGLPIAALDQPASPNERLDAGTQSILNFINPNDIASVEVLKDPSTTAIYGARAAGGIILITTKRGSTGRPVLSYNVSYAIQKHSDIFDVYPLKEWMVEKNNSSWDMWMFENDVTPYGSRSLETAMEFPKNGVHYKLPYTDDEISNAGEGTDWVGLITRLGSIQQHNLSVQGGTELTKYMVSFNYFDQKGIIKNSELKRFTGRINFDQNLGKIFKLGLNLTASRLNSDNTPLGDQPWEKSGMLRAAVQMGPHIPAINEDGTYPINPLLPTQPNPYSLLTVTDKGYMDRIMGNVYLSSEPVKGLILKLNLGTDIAYQDRNTYMPKTTLHGALSGGIATINHNQNEQFLTELTANYNKTFNDVHQVTFLAGASLEKFKSSGNVAGNNDFITDAFLWYNLNAGEGNKIVQSSGGEETMKSFFSRLNYAFLNRYLLTVTFRADGYSGFAENKKWGYFPSVAVGWNMAEEQFMRFLLPTFTMLKLRASYGQTGNSNMGGSAFGLYYAAPAWNTIDAQPQVGVFPSQLENPNLKWETTTELNIGLDVAILKSRISGTFEIYNRVISDLLHEKYLNTYHDLVKVWSNMGKTQSKGFEATINIKNFSRQNFSWSTDFTFSMYRDRWLERTADWKPTVYQNENDPIRARYERVAVGILQAGEAPPEAQPDLKPGQIIIKDIDGYLRDDYGDPVVQNGKFMRTGAPDGIIDDADTRLMGTPDPGYIAGLTNHFKYKDFDLGIDLNGLFGRQMVDPTNMAFGVSADGIAQYGYNGLRTLKTRWTPDNPSTTQPSSFFGWSRYGYGDWFYENAWFIRLQNVRLGYTLSGPKFQKIFSSLHLYFDMNNLLVFTPYKGLDPETDAYAAAYPNARTYTFGLDIKF